jgi:hypothetical protein
VGPRAACQRICRNNAFPYGTMTTMLRKPREEHVKMRRIAEEADWDASSDLSDLQRLGIERSATCRGTNGQTNDQKMVLTDTSNSKYPDSDSLSAIQEQRSSILPWTTCQPHTRAYRSIDLNRLRAGPTCAPHSQPRPRLEF